MSTRTLDARNVSWSYPGAPAPLFEGLDLSLYAGERVALTGPNGSGKSTLLRLLAGEAQPSTGEVERPPRTTVVHQHDAIDTGGTVREAVLAELPSIGALERNVRAAEEAGLPDPLAYADAVAAYEAMGGYTLAARFEAAAERAGLPASALDRSAAALSGGQRRLLRLLGAFLAPADLVLLDEPTNHLDDDAAASLVETLRASAAAVLVVSHDRWFMDQVAERVLVLERGRLAGYRGTYTRARAAREADRLERERDRERLEREIAKLREAERTYKVWGVRKEKEKSGAFDKGFIGARAARLMKRGILAKERLADRRERLEERRPWVDKRYRLAFPAAHVPGGTCLAVQGLTVARGDFVLADAHLSLAWGERVAVSGPNGAGKSTLLSALVHPDGSAAVHWSPAARIGFARQVDDGDEGERLGARFEAHEADEARRLLGAFGVPGTAWDDPLGSLSLGGRRKSAFVRLILDGPNVLILDEPTTHLDLPSIELLEEALAPFPGTLLLVSHDRRLREAVTTREWRVDAGTVRDLGLRTS